MEVVSYNHHYLYDRCIVAICRDLLGSVVTLVRLRARTENITVTENYYKAPLLVLGSTEQLREVFLNLCANAADAMPRGGKIEVETLAQDKKCL